MGQSRRWAMIYPHAILFAGIIYALISSISLVAYQIDDPIMKILPYDMSFMWELGIIRRYLVYHAVLYGGCAVLLFAYCWYLREARKGFLKTVYCFNAVFPLSILAAIPAYRNINDLFFSISKMQAPWVLNEYYRNMNDVIHFRIAILICIIAALFFVLLLFNSRYFRKMMRNSTES